MSPPTMRILRAIAGLVALLMICPLAVVIIASLTADGFMTVPPSNWGLVWYVTALGDRQFIEPFKFSALIAFVVAMISGTLGAASAIAIQRYRFRGRDLTLTLVMAPMMLPHLLIAIGLLQLFAAVRLTTSPYGVIAGHVAVTLPFVVRLVMIGMAGIDPMLERAAYSLGASRLYALRRIIVPLMAPAVLAALVFAFILSFDEVTIAIFTSVPGGTTLPAQVFNYAANRSDPLIAAVSSMLILLGTVVVVVLDRAFGLLRLLSGGKLADIG